MLFKNTWQYEHELLRVNVLHPTEHICNFSTVLNINNKIQRDIDRSYDSTLERALLLLDTGNIEANQLHELQLEQRL
jgi:hypothetical protein